MATSNTQSTLRSQILSQLRSQSVGEHFKASSALLQRLQAWLKHTGSPFLNKNQIALFASLSEEISTLPIAQLLLQNSKKVYFPKITPQQTLAFYQVQDLDKDLQTGAFGISEPLPHCPKLPLTTIDLFLVPGVAFTKTGERIGRGKGYYDRALSENPLAVRIGLAFELQIVEDLPQNPWDQKMDWILTESSIYKGERNP